SVAMAGSATATAALPRPVRPKRTARPVATVPGTPVRPDTSSATLPRSELEYESEFNYTGFRTFCQRRAAPMGPSSPDSAPAVAGESLSALLIDFGGVLTTPISDAFDALGEEAGLAPGEALSLLAGHEGARTALREHEERRLDAEGFEDAFARAIVESGGRLAGRGLLARIGARMQLDEPMVELVL